MRARLRIPFFNIGKAFIYVCTYCGSIIKVVEDGSVYRFVDFVITTKAIIHVVLIMNNTVIPQDVVEGLGRLG